MTNRRVALIAVLAAMMHAALFAATLLYSINLALSRSVGSEPSTFEAALLKLTNVLVIPAALIPVEPLGNDVHMFMLLGLNSVIWGAAVAFAVRWVSNRRASRRAVV